MKFRKISNILENILVILKPIYQYTVLDLLSGTADPEMKICCLTGFTFSTDFFQVVWIISQRIYHDLLDLSGGQKSWKKLEVGMELLRCPV